MSGSLAGQFLIAGKHLRDPNFFQSVVLIVEHNDQGAMGLIVNRPAGIKVNQALQGHFELPDNDMQVYNGGPVERNALFILHDSSDYDQKQSIVAPGLYVGNSAEIFEKVVRRAIEGDPLKFRIFAGCSGWGPKQLEGEMDRGDWLTTPANMGLVFHPDPYAVWEMMLDQARNSVTPIAAPHVPPSPDWN